MVEERPVEDRDDGFRGVKGQRPEPCALTSGKEDRLHA